MGIKLSDDKKSMNVKEMLQEGIKPEEMMKQLQDEINIAQKEIAANETLTEAREELLDAAVNYLVALDLIESDDISDSDYDTLIDIFESYEEGLKKTTELSDLTDDDVILKVFLGSL